MNAVVKNYNGVVISRFRGNSKRRLFNKIRKEGIIRSDSYIVVSSANEEAGNEYFRMTKTGKIFKE